MIDHDLNAQSYRDRHDQLEHLLMAEVHHIRDTLGRIERQVLATNGRVSLLEKWKYGMLCAVGTLAAAKWPEIKLLLGILQ